MLDMSKSPAPPVADVIEEKARTDARYAIAYAILRVAEAQTVIADRLYALGFNARIRDAPGTTEFIGTQLKDLVTAVSELGVACSR
jgi:hypothetical protein